MMSHVRGPTVRLRAQGPLACWTRPELKAERVSYPVPTPSGARGLVEAVLWKPAIRWRIERIKVLAPIQSVQFRRNELNRKAVAPRFETVASGGLVDPYLADEDRAQRNTIALRDVDYVIEARFEMTERAGPEDNPVEFVEMFNRRLERGQCFHRPYFGCRECVADVSPVGDDTPEPIEDTRDLGLMLWDLEFGAERNRPRFFRARLERGVLEVPDSPLGADEPGKEGDA